MKANIHAVLCSLYRDTVPTWPGGRPSCPHGRLAPPPGVPVVSCCAHRQAGVAGPAPAVSRAAAEVGVAPSPRHPAPEPVPRAESGQSCIWEGQGIRY